MKKALLALAALTLFGIPSASAKTPVKPIPVVQLLPQVSAHMSQTDNISQLLTTSQSVYFVGTLETSTTTLVTQPSLGGASDGFICSYNWQGVSNWSLRLGGASDDIASAEIQDQLGNVWVAGASTIPTQSPTPYPTPTNVYNPGHISVSPAPVMATGLRRLMLWKISPAGTLLGTYSTDFVNVILPQSISLKKNDLVIAGFSNDPSGSQFQVVVSPQGVFSKTKFTSAKESAHRSITVVKSMSYLWQSYETDRPVAGIPAFKPRTLTSILIKSSNKTGKVEDLYELPGALISFNYQKSVGIVLLTQSESDYGINFIKTP